MTFDCRPDVLRALAAGLASFGPNVGLPEWLVSAVWLETGEAQYIATPFAQVLPDGFVARGLHIGTPEDLEQAIEAERARVSGHLLARGNTATVPSAEPPIPPPSLKLWACEEYSTHVLVRVSERPSRTNRVACGLLFTPSEGDALLVASDPSIMAMILTDDPELIGRYCECCEELPPEDYLALRRP